MSSQIITSQPAEPPSFLSKHGQKLIALAFWLALIGVYFWYRRTHEMSSLAMLQMEISLLAATVYGPLIFIGIYALRPLIFFSAVLLTIAGGYLFGPVLGVIYVVIGANLSAMIAYSIGRFFGKGVLETEGSDGFVQRYAKRMRENSFETVLIMRFIFLPYDLVNYLSGLLQIDWKAFLLATVLGSLPGTISFTLIGASIEGDFTGGIPSLDPWTLAASVAIFVLSLGISRYFKRRETK
jgi:uncharacterized membrane protein YdjX (TVP38/TMEM64 family)